MKLFLFFILLFAATIYTQEPRTVTINKNTQGGYDIISNGELVYEFTKLNIDSASLSTLDEIYFEGERQGSKDGVVFVMPAEKGFDVNVFMPILGAVLLAWLTYLSVKRHYNRQIRAENKRAWLEKVRDNGASLLDIFRKRIFYTPLIESHQTRLAELDTEYELAEENNASPDVLKRILETKAPIVYQYKKLSEEIENLSKMFWPTVYSFELLLSNKKHSSFLKQYEEFKNSVNINDTNQEADFKDITEALKTLINDEQDKLDRGEF